MGGAIPIGFFELEAYVNTATEKRAEYAPSHLFLKGTMKQVACSFNASKKVIQDMGNADVSKHMADQYKKIIADFPELKHAKDYAEPWKFLDEPR